MADRWLMQSLTGLRKAELLSLAQEAEPAMAWKHWKGQKADLTKILMDARAHHWNALNPDPQIKPAAEASQKTLVSSPSGRFAYVVPDAEISAAEVNDWLRCLPRCEAP